MKKGAILAAFAVAVVLWCTGYAIGQKRGYSRGRGTTPAIVVQVDTVTITRVVVDTVYQVRTRVVELARVDTVTNTVTDTVAVEIPISRYVAHQDSLYHVEATGWGVEFEKIQVYPKTVTVTSTVEKLKTTRWGLGVQAGYGATIQDKTVRLTPYVGVGISYNLVSW